MIYGDRLRQARILRHEKLADIAAILGHTSSALSKRERSETIEISSEQLELLASKLRFPKEYFTHPPISPLGETDLLYRAPKSTLKREKDFLREFMRFTSELIEWLDDRRQLPPVSIRPQAREGIDIKEAARATRESLGVSATDPIDYLTHPVERAGVVVVVRRRRLSDNTTGSESAPVPLERHEGCSAWVGEFRDRPLIVMRSVQTWEKTRWVLSHELGHLILHAGRMPVTEHAEEEASQFASELLAPIDCVRRDLPKTITLSNLIRVKLKWGISLAALIRHLHGNGLISDKRKSTLYAQLYTRKNPDTGRTFGVTEPGWDARNPERPRLIAAWLSRVVGSAIPEAVASSTKMWPVDLLSEIIAEQRPAPTRAPTATSKNAESKPGQVIQLSLKRKVSSDDELSMDLTSDGRS
ncbi:XRE family transcriptional regulator [Nonomuraea sp. NPDC001831]|uniref:XRE family transcriptional regulator n=1 Tax=Nonomuraea sp. NPDC001831 TaxID=3364340 RepID=UPI0036B47C27